MSENDSFDQAPPAAPPQWSADGKFWWTGQQWIPASSLPSMPVQTPPSNDAYAMSGGNVAVAAPPTTAVVTPERTLLTAQRHILFYLAGPAIMGIFVFFASIGLALRPTFGAIVVIIFLAACTYGVYRLAMKSRAETRIFITDRRVGFSVGILRKRTFELLLPKVESMSTRKDILGRLFGYGSLVIGGTGGSKEVLVGMVNAERFAAVAQNAIHAAQTR